MSTGVDIEVPEGYDIQGISVISKDPDENYISLKTPNHEFFRITDRKFGYFDSKEEGIDWWTNGAVSKAIEESMQKYERVRVLDIGGGPRSQAAFDIVSRYENVWVVNIDLCRSPNVETHPRLTFIQDDVA